MPDRNDFFPAKHYLGIEINFSDSQGRWALTQKLEEQHDQYDEKEFEDIDGSSSACGIFQCRRPDDPAQVATMKIWMQYENPELSPYVYGVKHK
ncbi:hypothetical protein SI65_02297 [Aspergillus cristatus]|uniref:Uncharacterized protein n=1 Tax=Aspergillus cristatus TaxID=573508 RepID=A0A1E3BKD8_ASPCR|nr:hypothetical protein SI65_02297 [Aspergillus cristatus]